MKKLSISAACLLSMLSAGPAFASATYILTVTNGGNMPFSPALVYSASMQPTGRTHGMAASPGFLQLCQTGNPMLRAQELKASGVKLLKQTSGLIQPGESRSIEISVENPATHSVFFETMYGKSKDVCAVAEIGSHSLVAIKQHVTPQVKGRDQVIQTGAFADPMVANGTSYLDSALCTQAANAIECLRELAKPANGGRVKFFSAYLPSLLSQLEMKFGTEDVRTLMIPESGAAYYELKLKH